MGREQLIVEIGPDEVLVGARQLQPHDQREHAAEREAVFSGVGGWAGSIVSLGLDPRDLTAGNGWGNAMQDLSSRTRKGGALHVFAVP